MKSIKNRTELTSFEMQNLQTGAGDPYHFEYDTGDDEPRDGAWARWGWPLAILFGIISWVFAWSLVEPYLP